METRIDIYYWPQLTAEESQNLESWIQSQIKKGLGKARLACKDRWPEWRKLRRQKRPIAFSDVIVIKPRTKYHRKFKGKPDGYNVGSAFEQATGLQRRKHHRPGPMPNHAIDRLRYLVRDSLGITQAQIEKHFEKRKLPYVHVASVLSRVRRDRLREIIFGYVEQDRRISERQVRDRLTQKHAYKSRDRRRRGLIHQFILEARRRSS